MRVVNAVLLERYDGEDDQTFVSRIEEGMIAKGVHHDVVVAFTDLTRSPEIMTRMDELAERVSVPHIVWCEYETSKEPDAPVRNFCWMGHDVDVLLHVLADYSRSIGQSVQDFQVLEKPPARVH